MRRQFSTASRYSVANSAATGTTARGGKRRKGPGIGIVGSGLLRGLHAQTSIMSFATTLYDKVGVDSSASYFEKRDNGKGLRKAKHTK